MTNPEPVGRIDDPSYVVHQRIEECQGMVRSLALSVSRKLPSSVELDDLIAYGQVGLGEAARDFDPSRGSRFSTYAYYRIRGAIYDGVSKMAWCDRTRASQVRYDQMSNEVLRLESEADASAEASDLEGDACWLRNVSQTLAVVYVASHAGCEPSEEERGPAGLVDRSSPDAATVAIRREISKKLHAFIEALPPMAAGLIRGIYFEGLTLHEAGQRIGVSKSWASRLHSRALGQLARLLRGGGISAS
jgi:RNA polymerase sigma factor for flagellar operon FliA